MAFRSASLRLATTIQDRTLYLRVKPAPKKLSERRAVLRALKQCGPIEVFKKLYDDSSFISVTRDITTFWNIKKKSPFQFDYQDELGPNVFDPRVASSRPQSESPKTGTVDNGQTFTVEVFAAPDYRHKDAIQRSPLYGPWPPRTNKSLTTAALSQVVPRDMAGKGLADWETGAQVEDHDARIAWQTSKSNTTKQRLLRKEHQSILDELAKMLNRDGDVER